MHPSLLQHVCMKGWCRITTCTSTSRTSSESGTRVSIGLDVVRANKNLCGSPAVVSQSQPIVYTNTACREYKTAHSHVISYRSFSIWWGRRLCIDLHPVDRPELPIPEVATKPDWDLTHYCTMRQRISHYTVFLFTSKASLKYAFSLCVLESHFYY